LSSDIYAGTIEHLRDYGTLKAMVRRMATQPGDPDPSGGQRGLGFRHRVAVTLASRHGIVSAGVSMQLAANAVVAVFAIIVATCWRRLHFGEQGQAWTRSW